MLFSSVRILMTGPLPCMPDARSGSGGTIFVPTTSAPAFDAGFDGGALPSRQLEQLAKVTARLVEGRVLPAQFQALAAMSNATATPADEAANAAAAEPDVPFLPHTTCSVKLAAFLCTTGG